MSQAEVEWMSCHLGHDINTLKKSYRQQTSAITITKVGASLNLIDSGTVDRHQTLTPDTAKQGLFSVLYL